MRFCSLLIGALLILAGHCPANAQAPKSLAVESNTGRFVGLPIHWGASDAALLETNGRIRVLQQAEIRDHRLLEQTFQPWTTQESRSTLQSELGAGFDTQVTGSYVIAAPKGQVARWESKFRSLLAGYQRFFETRGLSLRKPDFPLVVIVLQSQSDFVKMAQRETDGAAIGNNFAGMYSPRTNRCLLFHQATGDSPNWHATEATIVHEAVHQLAYNTGVHERLFDHPLWMVEGLATMFEVPAVYDINLASNDARKRINFEKSSEVIQLVGDDSNTLGSYLDNIVTTDHLFRSDPQSAYALAWALTFYLAERMPKQYFEYIELQRSRGFQSYSDADRNIDFRRAFKAAPSQLAVHILQLIQPK